ncbi:MAG: CRISPR-associated endonuclease Cas2 [Bacteroidales bacterium]|nr:CRISPR-associated endonuclease Cas2 [Porphyromonas sp.]MDD6935302.1 CRISPR-associated endonuclease Cas2 [Bacteroidales bacterium]MDY3102255.1 CRISPR-associated endonuclease Cas2 [Porphyromonas sp.]
MYVILVYDVGEKRTAKMLKLCRRYLNWIQNSVFEGEITEVKLKELKIEASYILDRKEDSIIIFSSRQQRWLEKEILGKERAVIDNFL